jgi:hypothetical protein
VDVDAVEIAKLSDRALGELIYALTVEIASIQSQVEPPTASRKRTWRLIRSTILMAGGFFGATVDLWSLILAALGMWDWLDSVSEDAVVTNRQIDVSQRLTYLDFKLALATIELRKRKQTAAESK